MTYIPEGSRLRGQVMEQGMERAMRLEIGIRDAAVPRLVTGSRYGSRGSMAQAQMA
jgi:hypothetical protein